MPTGSHDGQKSFAVPHRTEKEGPEHADLLNTVQELRAQLETRQRRARMAETSLRNTIRGSDNIKRGVAEGHGSAREKSIGVQNTVLEHLEQ
jgi:hypothetical protein